MLWVPVKTDVKNERQDSFWPLPEIVSSLSLLLPPCEENGDREGAIVGFRPQCTSCKLWECFVMTSRYVCSSFCTAHLWSVLEDMCASGDGVRERGVQQADFNPSWWGGQGAADTGLPRDVYIPPAGPRNSLIQSRAEVERRNKCASNLGIKECFLQGPGANAAGSCHLLLTKNELDIRK